MRNFNMHPLDQVFLLLRRVMVLDFFVFNNLCPWTSQWVSWVLNVFPNMFVTSSHMLFAQSWPLGTYIRGHISHDSMLAMKSSVWGDVSKVLEPFLWWADQRGSLPKTNTWAWKGPQTNYYRSQYISIKMWHLRWWNRADIKMMMASCVRILHLGRPCGL
jgi:hypothetical protein